MADDKNKSSKDQSIVIKRIKKGGHGHHGGAWKVAYADFVTAMMAFFLLLWLLAVATKDQKQGIADYFTPTVGVGGEMGIGFKGGREMDEEGNSRNKLSRPGIVFGAPPTVGPIAKAPESGEKKTPKVEVDQIQAEEIEKKLEEKRFKEIEEKIKKAIEENQKLSKFKEGLLIDETPEGLRIQLTDLDKISMFELGSSKLKADAEPLLQMLSQVIQQVPNKVSIIGHTDSVTYKNNAEYTNWELSADRANSSRRFFLKTGLPPTRIHKVEGKSDREHLVPEDPKSPKNRRISVILLKKSIAAY